MDVCKKQKENVVCCFCMCTVVNKRGSTRDIVPKKHKALCKDGSVEEFYIQFKTLQLRLAQGYCMYKQLFV